MFLFIHGDTDSFLFQLKHSWKFPRQTDCQDGRIDYKCEDGHFLVSAICVPFSNPYSLTSNETRVNPQIRSWKMHFSDWTWCQKAIGDIYSSKKRRAETLRFGFEFDNFKPGLESGTFTCISWQNGSFFGSDDRGFLKDGVVTYLLVPMSLLNWFCLHIHSLWIGVTVVESFTSRRSLAGTHFNTFEAVEPSASELHSSTESSTISATTLTFRTAPTFPTNLAPATGAFSGTAVRVSSKNPRVGFAFMRLTSYNVLRENGQKGEPCVRLWILDEG